MARRPTLFQWRGVLPARLELRAVRIRFAHTRTALGRIELDAVDGEAVGRIARFEVRDFVAEAVLGPRLRAEEDLAVVLSVSFTGEAPRPVAVTLYGDTPLELPSWYPAWIAPDAPPTPGVAARLWRLELERIALPVEADGFAPGAPGAGGAFGEREVAIRLDALSRRAFHDHDLGTNPHENALLWAQQMADLNDLLGDRVEIYARLGQNGLWPRCGKIGQPMLGKLVAVSAAFRAVFEPLLAEEPGRDLFDWAFGHFVTGALATRHDDPVWRDVLLFHGAPNSSYFLRYAMLAVVALESDVDAPFWSGRLRTLVRAAHVFLESAAPLKDAPYPSPEVEYAFQPDRLFPRSRQEDLREEYDTTVGAAQAWDAQLDLLRARLASLLGLALVPPGQGGILVPKEPIDPAGVATLKAQGVGDPVTQVLGP